MSSTLLTCEMYPRGTWPSPWDFAASRRLSFRARQDSSCARSDWTCTSEGREMAQPGLEKRRGLTNVPHLNPGLREGEDHVRPMEMAASHGNGSLTRDQIGKASPSLVRATKEGRRHPKFQRWIRAGGNHRCMGSWDDRQAHGSFQRLGGEELAG